MSHSERTCPVCGSHKWGSSLNKDGTMTRYCHGTIVQDEVGNVLNTGLSQAELGALVRAESIRTAHPNTTPPFRYQLSNCKVTWHSNDDEANGVHTYTTQDPIVAGVVK